MRTKNVREGYSALFRVRVLFGEVTLDLTQTSHDEETVAVENLYSRHCR